MTLRPPVQEPESRYDLAGGDNPPENPTVTEVLKEAEARRGHRFAALVLVYVVVSLLIVSVWKLVDRLSQDLTHLNPAAVGLVASLVVAVSVLTIALGRFAYGMSVGSEAKPKSEPEVTGPPATEAFKLAGDLLSKVGELFKSMKP